MKNKSILRNMLISYAVIIFIYIGAWSVLQIKAVSILKEQTNIIYSDLLTVFSGMVDNEILDIKKVSLDIAMDPVNVSLMDGFRRKEAYDAEKTWAVRQKLHYVKSNAWSMDTVFVYIKDADKVISDTTAASPRLFFDNYMGNLDLTYEVWEENLTVHRADGYQAFKNKDGNSTVIYFQPIPLGRPSKVEGVLAIVVSTSAIQEQINEIQKDHDIKIDIMTEHGKDVVRAVVEKPQDFKTIEHTSEKTGWTYKIYVPLSSFKQQENLFVMLALAMIASATVIGILIVCYSIRKSYTPLKELVIRMQKSMEEEGTSENEVDYLWNSFQVLAEKQKNDETRLNHQIVEMKSLFIGQMFHGRTVSGRTEEEYLHLFKLQFVKEAFVVLIIRVKEEAGWKSEGVLERDGICITGVPIFSGGRTIEKDDYFYVLDASEYAMEELVAELERFQEICFCKIVMSAIHRGCEEISQAYNEVLGMDGYTDMSDTKNLVIYTGDTLKEAAWQSEYAAVEKKLVNAVLARQKVEAKKYLGEIWELVYRDGPISIGEIKFLFMGLLNGILNESRDSDSRKIILDCSRRIRLFSGNGAVQNLRDISYETIQALCQEKKEETSKEKALKHQVLAYIDHHYAEEELSVNSICREIERSASSVMKAFGDGNGVLYYINERRILEAKRMILEQNGEVGIAKVSGAIGYGNQNTFIRVFKKYEGITPGKFCELVKRMQREEIQ